MSDIKQSFINRLTDAYNKSPNSNVSKVAELLTFHLQENEELLDTIYDWRDIDQAPGKVLDGIGSDVAQNRGLAPDEVYRLMIKAKVKRNRSDSTIDSLIDFLSFMLNIPVNEVIINEMWEVGRPATLQVDIPAEAINQTGLSLTQFGTLINLVAAAGVRVETLFSGTFQLTASLENDPETGLAPVDQSIGGTLSKYFDSSQDYDLPI